MPPIGLPASLIVLGVVVAACLVVVATVPGRETEAQTALVPRSTASPTATGEATARTAGPTGAASPSPSRETTPRATGGTVAGASDAALLRAVSEVLDARASGVSTAVVVTRLIDGRGVALDGDRVYYAASLFKLAILYEVLRRVSDGELLLDDRLQLSEGDFAEDLGTGGDLALDSEGEISFTAALEAMVTRSDNVTAVALLHYFGGARIDATLASLGLLATSVNEEALPTTAADMATLMTALVTGAGLSDEAWAVGRDLLTRQQMREAALAGLPDGIAAGGKWGAWPDFGGAGHDVIFVQAPRGTYVLAVLTDQPWGWGLIAELSRAVYLTLQE